MGSSTKPGFAPLELARPRIEAEDGSDGSTILRSQQPLGEYPPHLGVWLRHWAERAPDRTMLAERNGQGGWRTVRYAEAERAARSIGQALLDRGLGPEGAPVMILSGNGVDHALLMLGGFYAGAPVAPISPAYSLMSEDFAKLRHIHDLLQPAVVYVSDGGPFTKALEALDLDGTEVVASHNGPGGATESQSLMDTEPGDGIERRVQSIGPDTVAKILFTSGSTGTPKGVLNTHRMLCSNQQAIRQCWPFLEKRPPVLVDWLPWNHTFGGNHNFNLVLANGGTLHIDGGKPRPGLVEHTVENLREVSPTVYFNVPAGFNMLLPYLERDQALRERFFAELDLIFYAGAALSEDAWKRLEDLSIQARGERIMMTSAWGSTETSPLATSAHFPLEKPGNIGVPAPGTEIKLAPVGAGSKRELRVRGPNVTPGYHRQPELTAQTFDEEGFYRIGDAGMLVDPEDPSSGIVFAGRVSEDFKLSSGTWVHVGSLRLAAITAASPVIQDAVVTGHNRDWIGLLVWPNIPACRDLIGDSEETPPEQLVRTPTIREHLARGLQAHNRDHNHGSTRIRRVLLMAEPPSIDAGEITDKGYVNQATTLERRRALVDRLYEEPPGEDVIVLD
jgi:feruloyl-CoA synthase